ncbi:MAG: helix-turn-helix transcriptional regulator [Hyphomicrobiales bacterium]|nr:helix-turn-helix transcriptional regulator [Hyphomicrobiales bacterium]MCP5372451.1 helix-turn-helix transcriptional regulator [Hyphomicrobiales bacterium]
MVTKRSAPGRREPALDADQAARRLAALGNPTRLALFRLLIRAGTEGMNIGEVQARAGIPPSTLAHHLRALTDAGVVRQEKRGREVINTALYAAIDGLLAYLTDECCLGFGDGTACAPGGEVAGKDTAAKGALAAE